MPNLSFVFLIVLVFTMQACGGGGNETPPPIPTAEELGKLIFEDKRLSANSNQSCADCHDTTAGFADPEVTKTNPVSEGSITGSFGERNAPTSSYASFTPAFRLINDPVRGQIYAGGQFLDGRRHTLEAQAKDPFLNMVEMANASKQAVVDKVASGPYTDKFKTVYGESIFSNTDLAYNKIAEAIAAFERSQEMNRFNSKFDCYLRNPAQYPLSSQEQAGLDIFDGKGKCTACHSIEPDPVAGKVLLTNFQYFNIGVPSNVDNPANIRNANFVDRGLGARLGMSAENGKFKTPTLRNVAKTAPYMHNGVFQTLEEVMLFYNIDEKVFSIPAPEVVNNINTDVDFLGLIEPAETDAVVAFMKTLTDGTGVGLCF